MPVLFASPSFLLFLAVAGGLIIHLRLRRIAQEPLLAGLPTPASTLRRCLNSPDSAFPSPEPRPASRNPFPPAATGELILLVEDDASVRNLLSTVLLNHGYEVVTARDGEEGLVLFQQHQSRLALVITDMDLPRSTGRTFAEFVRPLRPGVRILFMSGLDDQESASARTQDPFLLKPFKPAVLLHTVHGLLHPTVATS